MGTETVNSVAPGQSIGARAIEARAAVATAHLRSTVTSISSAVDPTSAHGARITSAIDGLVAGVMPELEAAESMLRGDNGSQHDGRSALGGYQSLRSVARASAHRGAGIYS
ncbi:MULTISPECIES: hypothetical protein [Tsukamurella]|uniref:Uncharacterized protein n=1 Tax=Tsukamurella strandjordii TaxID=147577 RepID=A0AA90NLM1_9ACTN|nr:MULTISPECIES: hypothetical protein [Tsukamurella]MDP0399929.1 hypothetical protein [Tsukamurella strandjordii]